MAMLNGGALSVDCAPVVAADMGNTWFSFLSFSNTQENDGSLLLGEEAEFKIILETSENKTNIFVEPLGGSMEEAEALISKINELLS